VTLASFRPVHSVKSVLLRLSCPIPADPLAAFSLLHVGSFVLLAALDFQRLSRKCRTSRSGGSMLSSMPRLSHRAPGALGLAWLFLPHPRSERLRGRDRSAGQARFALVTGREHGFSHSSPLQRYLATMFPCPNYTRNLFGASSQPHWPFPIRQHSVCIFAIVRLGCGGGTRANFSFMISLSFEETCYPKS